MAELPANAAEPVFVGGTGRSGTHAAAQLVGSHSCYRYINREIRFHTDKGGLGDLLAGRVGMKRFLARMRGHWWHRHRPEGREGGLHKIVGPEEFERVLAEFERSFESDRVGASARLTRAFLDPLAEKAGKPSWVEQSTRTIAGAPHLTTMFPRARFIHMVRDGRDVACSLVSLPWGPDSLMTGIARWERQLRAADAGGREMGPERLLQVPLEELVITNREPTYDRILEFLGVDDEPEIRSHFENHMVSSNANLARWELDLTEPEQRELTRAYARSLESLTRDGVRAAEVLAERADLPADDGRAGTPLTRRIPSLFRR